MRVERVVSLRIATAPESHAECALGLAGLTVHLPAEGLRQVAQLGFELSQGLAGLTVSDVLKAPAQLLDGAIEDLVDVRLERLAV